MKKPLLLTAAIILVLGFNSCNNKLKKTKPEDLKATPLNIRLRLIIEQDFGLDNSDADRIWYFISQTLNETGFEVLEWGDTINYNQALQINIKGVALKRRYASHPFASDPSEGVDSYSGAEITGTFRFIDSNGVKADSSTFSNRISPEYKIDNIRHNPWDAPLLKTFYTSNFFVELGNTIAKRYGNNALFFYWLSIYQYNQDKREPISTHYFLEQEENAMQAIGNLRDPRIIRPVLKSIYSSRAIARKTDIASKIGEPAVDLLTTILLSDLQEEYKRDDSTERAKELNTAFAACALGKIGNKKAEDPLTKAFKSKSSLVKLWSAFALYKLGDLQKFDVIITAYHDKSSDVDSDRDAVAVVLGETMDKKAIEPLFSIWKYDNERSGNTGNKTVYEALKKVTGQDLANDYKTWVDWWEKNK